MSQSEGVPPTKSITVLVCGGRGYPRRDRVFRALDDLAEQSEENPLGETMVTVVHGDCPTGADRWADEWALVNWAPCKRYPAAWDVHGRSAGPIRNQQMLNDSKPDLVLAFPGGPGTADMVQRARMAGVEVREILR